ncbi:transketolase [Lactonifactor longoviformis]|uniref:transketolase n=1 Tax=Lactonifactor longoviformis TaxID=341220 RepID=UPI0036F3AD7B
MGDTDEVKRLQEFALRIRMGIVEEIQARGFGHLGGSLSIADALAVLYGEEMRVQPDNPQWEDRDMLVCSKGHAGPAVYAALALKGFFPYDWLVSLNQPGTRLPSHCDAQKTPGVDMTTGSLGQGASLAAGLALGKLLKKSPGRVFLILGDGELNEGQVWETFQFASAKALSNLVVLIDKNNKQLDGYTRDVLDTGSILDKMRAFGFESEEIHGNSVEELRRALSRTRDRKGMPSAIVLHTVKGKGIREAEETMANHSMNVSYEKCQEWLLLLQHELEMLRREV